MPNVFGIQSDADCQNKIDELLELCRAAEQSMKNETIANLNASLTEYHKAGNTLKAESRMSVAEKVYF
jgi:hypothetical protein